MTNSLIPHLARVDVFSHGIRVSRFNDATRRVLVEFCYPLIQYAMKPAGRGRFESQPARVFAAATRTRSEYFFHRNQLDDLIAHMRRSGIERERLEIIERPMYTPVTVEFDWTDQDRTLLDYQEPIVDFFYKPIPIAKLLTLQTGKGKTFTTLFSMRHMQVRVLLVIKPMYMDQWVAEAVRVFGFKKGDIYTVAGSKALKTLMDLALEDEDFAPKMIVLSNATYRNYIRSYLDNPNADVGYKVLPWELYEKLSVGLRVTDEVHQDFHLNFIIDTMTNVPKSIGLSATMESDDRFMNDMYAIMFKPECYAPTPAIDKYIDIYSVTYRFDHPERIRYLNPGKQYSQVIYEKSIMRQKKVWANYVKMLVDLSYHQWYTHSDYRPGMKIAVFCGMKEMVEAVVKAMEIKYPDKKVRRFVDVDPDEHLVEGDIIVTTLQSCGTAKDIPDLGVCLTSIALSSKQSNEQLIGRLRKLKRWPDITPRFIFLTCRDNPKHLKYLEEKRQKLDSKVRNFNAMTSGFVI